jgi:hypothetical protein
VVQGGKAAADTAEAVGQLAGGGGEEEEEVEAARRRAMGLQEQNKVLGAIEAGFLHGIKRADGRTVGLGAG